MDVFRALACFFVCVLRPITPFRLEVGTDMDARVCAGVDGCCSCGQDAGGVLQRDASEALPLTRDTLGQLMYAPGSSWLDGATCTLETESIVIS